MVSFSEYCFNEEFMEENGLLAKIIPEEKNQSQQLNMKFLKVSSNKANQKKFFIVIL